MKKCNLVWGHQLVVTTVTSAITGAVSTVNGVIVRVLLAFPSESVTIIVQSE